MAVNLSSLAGVGWQFFNDNGVPLAGGLIYTYQAGTSTPAATYTSSTGLIAHSNPIVLDAAGRVPGGEIWLTNTQDYKFLVKTFVGVQIGSYDNVAAFVDAVRLSNTSDPTLGDALVGFRQSNSSGNLAGSVGRTVHQKLQESVSVKDFGAVGNGSTDDTAAIQAALDSGALSIFVPEGIYLISSTLFLRKSGVKLYGEGGNYYYAGTSFYRGSIFKYTGSANIVLKCSPVVASGVPIFASSVENISIDGNALATIGLYIEASIQCIFNNLSIRRCSVAALKTGAIPTSEGFTGLNYVHSCSFSNLWIDQDKIDDGDGILLDGAVASTTTVCTFQSIYIFHNGGNGLTLKIADANLFQGLFIGRNITGSTSYGIELKGVAVPGKAVNSNTFIGVSAGIGGIISRSAPPPGYNAFGNVIYGLLIDSGCPLPVIESPSTLYYQINFDANEVENAGGFNTIKLIADGGAYTLLNFGGAGTAGFGIDFNNGNFSGGMIRYKNNTAIRSRNAADTADIEVGRVNTINEWVQALPMRLNDGINFAFSQTTGTKIGTGFLQKIGFWGSTPVVQPVDIPDTSGATLAQLETEVNTIKALLRSTGLMAT